MQEGTVSLEESYRIRNPRSREHFERGRGVMPGGAKGAYFYTFSTTHSTSPWTSTARNRVYWVQNEKSRAERR